MMLQRAKIATHLLEHESSMLLHSIFRNMCIHLWCGINKLQKVQCYQTSNVCKSMRNKLTFSLFGVDANNLVLVCENKAQLS